MQSMIAPYPIKYPSVADTLEFLLAAPEMAEDALPVEDIESE